MLSDDRRPPAASRAVTDFLRTAALKPAALVFEGEPGIGKTTRWLDAADLARDRGFQVLSTRPTEAESQLAYAAVADLFRDVDSAVFQQLPEPQRIAVDRALLRAVPDAVVEPHATGVALLSVVEQLAGQAPVLLAIDDLQWTDPSSRSAIDFVSRRVAGPVGVLAAVRTGPSMPAPTAGIQLDRPDATTRVPIQPMEPGVLRRVVSERLGRPLSRAAMEQIEQNLERQSLLRA